MNDYESIFKTIQYTGTFKSARALIKSLGIKPHSYFFDLITKEITVFRDTGNIRYAAGDYYQHLLPQKYECI